MYSVRQVSVLCAFVIFCVHAVFCGSSFDDSGMHSDFGATDALGGTRFQNWRQLMPNAFIKRQQMRYHDGAGRGGFGTYNRNGNRFVNWGALLGSNSFNKRDIENLKRNFASFYPTGAGFGKSAPWERLALQDWRADLDKKPSPSADVEHQAAEMQLQNEALQWNGDALKKRNVHTILLTYLASKYETSVTEERFNY